jgi:hypothetical protein
MVFKGTVPRDFLLFKWIYIERASYQDPQLIYLKFLYCVVVEILNFKGSLQLMQKTYLFPLQIGQQMHLKSIGYPDTVLFPTIGKEGNVLLPYIGKSVIYCRKVQVVAANFIKYWSPG